MHHLRFLGIAPVIRIRGGICLPPGSCRTSSSLCRLSKLFWFHNLRWLAASGVAGLTPTSLRVFFRLYRKLGQFFIGTAIP